MTGVQSIILHFTLKSAKEYVYYELKVGTTFQHFWWKRNAPCIQ